MRTCLLVIDAQESFRHRPYFSSRDVPAYLDRQNALIDGARARDIPIVRVFHVERAADSAFSLESGHVRPLTGLIGFDAALTVHKSRHSALIGSGLDVWLNEQGIDAVIVSGIRTEQCCETTARHAYDLGYRVHYVPDATLTFDMQYEDGTLFPAAEIKRRTVAVLKDRFATICSVEEALDAAARH
jgi:Amidases related to nicotinamidase